MAAQSYSRTIRNAVTKPRTATHKWTVADVLLRSSKAFSNNDGMNRLCQAIAEYFYPERADFITNNVPGEERYYEIFDEEPMLLRRNLANQIGALIRPRGREWFKCKAKPSALNKMDPVRIWCEQATKVTRDVIYSPNANFTATMTASDNDYVAFGVSVVTHTYNSDRTGLIFNVLHPRDCAWYKNIDGQIDEFYEKLKHSLLQLDQMGLTIPKDLRDELTKDPHREIEIIRCVYPVKYYQGEPGSMPREAKYAVMYVSAAYNTELKPKSGVQPYFRTFPYWVREWMNVSGEPRGRSPCTSVALSTARGLNQTALSIIEGLEKLVSPPLIAPDDGIAGEVQLRSNGITFYDPTIEYGSRSPIEALPVGRPDFGMAYAEDRKGFLARAFLQNIINFPQVTKEMTAYEAGRLWEQYMRDASPVFEPMEADNGRLLEPIFERIYDAEGPAKSGGYPPPPEELWDAEVDFEFETPLSAAYARIEFEKAMEATQYIAARIQINPGVIDLVDHDAMDRAALTAIVPQSWVRNEDDVQRERDDREEQAAQVMAANAAIQKSAVDSGMDPKGVPQLPGPGAPITEMMRA